MVKFSSTTGAFLFSSTLHLFVLLGVAQYPFHLEGNEAMKLRPNPTEVSYFKMTEPLTNHPQAEKQEPIQKKSDLPAIVLPLTRSHPLSETVKIALPEAAPHPVSLTSPGDQNTAAPFPKILSEAEMIETLHLNGTEKPIFLSYYGLIREKIRQNLFAYYRHGGQKGEVFLNFILFANGHLKEVKALEKGEARHPALKEIAMRSVVDASPFPPFPEGLKRSSASIWVTVTFTDHMIAIQTKGE